MKLKTTACLTPLSILILLFSPHAGAQQPSNIMVSENSFAKIASLFLKAESDEAFVTLTIAGTADFIQFNKVRGQVQIDFPLATPRQKQMRPHVEKALKDLGLPYAVTKSPNSNMEFIDTYLPHENPSRIARTLQSLFRAIFQTHPGTLYKLDIDGFQYISD